MRHYKQAFPIPLLSLFFLFFLHLFLHPCALAGEVTIKFATLAPEGSTWMKVMQEMDSEIREKTGGNVRFKIYAGGVSGDEKDAVRKMRLGQLHSAGFSGVGLGDILPEVRVLDLPFLFNNEAEVDFIQSKYFDYFYHAFLKEGHVLLGWAEIGNVYIFSNNEIHALSDMKKVKMWMWEGDPLAGALFKVFDLSPYPLSVTDVLMALQTGMIDTVYISPLGAISLQWHTKVKYMLDLPMAVSVGAVTVTKKQFDLLSPEHQDILRKVSAASLRKLTLLSREDNQKSIQLMKEYGIGVISLSGSDKTAEFKKTGERVREELSGKLFSPELIGGILRDLNEFRKTGKPNPNKIGKD